MEWYIKSTKWIGLVGVALSCESDTKAKPGKGELGTVKLDLGLEEGKGNVVRKWNIDSLKTTCVEMNTLYMKGSKH